MDRAKLLSMLSLRTLGATARTNVDGSGTVVTGQAAPQPDEIYMFVSSGVCWFRTDGATVVQRESPGRLCTSWALFVGEGKPVTFITDAIETGYVAVSVEGPIDPELAAALLGFGPGVYCR